MLYVERKVDLSYCGIHCKIIIFTENERNQMCEDKLSCLLGVKKCKLVFLYFHKAIMYYVYCDGETKMESVYMIVLAIENCVLIPFCLLDSLVLCSIH